jgi:K+-transporting ATPase KdpF subunit
MIRADGWIPSTSLRTGSSLCKNGLLGMAKTMDLQSLIMLVVSALTAVYLFYALLRPEKF